MGALTERERQEFTDRMNDPARPEEERRNIAIFLIQQAESEQTTAAVRETVREGGIPAPEGRREELLAAEGEGDQFVPLNRAQGINVSQEHRARQTAGGAAGAEGAQRRFVAIGDFLRRPFTPEEQQGERAEQRRQENAQATVELLENADALGIDPAEVYRSIGAGEFLPDVVLSMTGPMLAKTVTGRVVADAAIGGSLIGSLAEGDESALALTTLGTLGSGMLGMVTEIPSMASKVIAGDVLKALKQKFGSLENVPQNPFLPTEASQITGVAQSVGETTGSSRVLALEAETQSRAQVGGAAETFARDRAEASISGFGKVADVLNPEKLSATSVVKALDGLRKTAVRDIGKVASDAWRQTIAPGLEAVGARIGSRGIIEGGEGFISTATVRAELNRIVKEASAPITADPARVKWALKQIEELKRGPLTIGEYQVMTRALGEGAVAEGVFINPKALQQALRADLEVTRVTSQSPAAQTAIDGLESANKVYAEQIAPAAMVNRIFIDKLGVDDVAMAGEEFVKKFDKLPASQKEAIFKTIHKYDKNLSRQLSAVAFKDTLERNTVLSTTTEFLDQPLEVLKIGSFAAEIAGKSAAEMRIMMNTPGLDEGQHKLLVAAFDQLNKLKGTPNVGEKAAVSALGKAREYFINAISRDAGFLGRLVAGEMTPSTLERWLYTPEGLNALLDIGRYSLNVGKGGTLAAGIAGMETLMGLQQQSTAQREALEQEIKRRRSEIANLASVR